MNMKNRIPSEAIDLVKKMKLGYLATLQADGKPCLLHKGTLTVLDDHHLIFADVASLDAVEILKNCPDVAVEVVDPFSLTGFRFRGKAKCEVNHFVLIQVESIEPSHLPMHGPNSAGMQLPKRWTTFFNNLWKF
jgi:hypothetical protein